MRGADVFVDLDALGELARQLRTLRADLEGAADPWAASGDLGSEAVEDAVARFVDGWREGRGRVVKGVTRLIRGVEAALDAYRENERLVAAAAAARATP